MKRLVSRSLLQVILAALLGLAFLAVVGVVGMAAGASFASMLAGGVVALVLLPLALALRRVTSRVLYGDREFPYRVVSELRQLGPAAAPGDTLHDMLGLLARSLRLSYASVEIHGRSPEDRVRARFGTPRGTPTSVVLDIAGTPIGQLDLEVTPTREPFGPRDRRLLEDVGSQVGAMVQAVLTSRTLQLSREGHFAAREEERRRVRRDLHDGLGPSLAAMAMKLEVARELIGQDPRAAARLLGQLTEQTRADIGEIRRLVDGLRPPALDQLGLVSALRQRAEEHNAAVRLGQGRSRMLWTVEADEHLEPLPAAVEVAAYRIVVEAVNNALRHSRADSCAVRLRRRSGTLEVEVRDTGNGLGTSSDGVGLGSMRERAEELGGSCSISSTPGEGTRVLVSLPLTTGAAGESAR